MQSKAKTVEAYLAELPEERRNAIQAIRRIIFDNIDKNFEEGMQYGMIGYYVPHRLYPAGYHCDAKQPLPFACLASQKNHMSLHMMSLYANSKNEKWFKEAWLKTGKKLDMGKCCVRFKKIDDVALEVVAEVFRRHTVEKYIDYYESAYLSQMNVKKTRNPGKIAKTGKKPKRGKQVRQ